MNKIALKAGVVAVALTLGSSQVVLAQEDSTRSIEKVVITGSNIKRIDTETATPVQILKREDITRLGVNSVREALATLTSSSDAKDVNIGLVSLDFLPALTNIVDNVKSGDFAGKSYIATIDNGGLVFKDLILVAAAPGVTDDLGDQITELGKQIVDGTVTIPATLP